LQDYQARAGIRELNGIAPLLELTRAEYPVIQELALVAIDRVTQDAENRYPYPYPLKQIPISTKTGTHTHIC